MYTFTAGSPVPHAEHNFEEWHAYLADEMPDWVRGSDSGICCHTCRTVVVDGAAIRYAAAQPLALADLDLTPR